MFIIKERYVYNCTIFGTQTGEVIMSEMLANDDDELLKFRFNLDKSRFNEVLNQNLIKGIYVKMSIYDQREKKSLKEEIVGDYYGV